MSTFQRCSSSRSTRSADSQTGRRPLAYGPRHCGQNRSAAPRLRRSGEPDRRSRARPNATRPAAGSGAARSTCRDDRQNETDARRDCRRESRCSHRISPGHECNIVSALPPSTFTCERASSRRRDVRPGSVSSLASWRSRARWSWPIRNCRDRTRRPRPPRRSMRPGFKPFFFHDFDAIPTRAWWRPAGARGVLRGRRLAH